MWRYLISRIVGCFFGSMLKDWFQSNSINNLGVNVEDISVLYYFQSFPHTSFELNFLEPTK